MSWPETTLCLITSSSLSFISLLWLGAAPPCVPAPRGVSAQFTFDGPGYPAALLIPGKVGQALHLNGVDQYLEIPAARRGVEMGSEDFTIEGWLRTRETRPRNIIDKRDFPPIGYLIFLQQGQLGFQLSFGADRSDAVVRGRTINDGAWHHFAVVARRLPPQPARIFIDGEEYPARGRSLTVESVDTPKIPLWFGRHHRNLFIDRDNMYFAGDLDEISFYLRPLTPEEIRAIHRAGSAGKCR